MKRIANKFKRMMFDKGIRTTKELAERSGVQHDQLKRIFALDTGVRFIDVATVAHYFNLSVKVEINE